MSNDRIIISRTCLSPLLNCYFFFDSTTPCLKSNTAAIPRITITSVFQSTLLRNMIRAMMRQTRLIPYHNNTLVFISIPDKKFLIVLFPQLHKCFRMEADRAGLICFLRLVNVPAVDAFPPDFSILNEDLVFGNVLQ